MFAVSAYISGTRGSGDSLEMSVVTGVGGVCYMCMCMTRGGGGVGGEWVTGLSLGLPILEEQRDSGICILVAVVWVILGRGSGWVACARV